MPATSAPEPALAWAEWVAVVPDINEDVLADVLVVFVFEFVQSHRDSVPRECDVVVLHLLFRLGFDVHDDAVDDDADECTDGKEDEEYE